VIISFPLWYLWKKKKTKKFYKLALMKKQKLAFWIRQTVLHRN